MPGPSLCWRQLRDQDEQDALGLEPLWTNKFWGNGNPESPFRGGQEDVADQVAFQAWLSSVTCSHRLILLSNLSSPISTPYIKESQATNGRLAESQQLADRWVNSSSLMGFLLLQDAIHMPRDQPAESAFKVKCAARPRTDRPCLGGGSPQVLSAEDQRAQCSGLTLMPSSSPLKVPVANVTLKWLNEPQHGSQPTGRRTSLGPAQGPKAAISLCGSPGFSQRAPLSQERTVETCPQLSPHWGHLRHGSICLSPTHL